MGELLGRYACLGWGRRCLVIFLVFAVLPAAPLSAQEDQEPRKAGRASPAPEAKSSGAKSAEAGPAGEKVRTVASADLWALDFTSQKVAVLQPTEGPHRGQVYWYMLYRLENKTSKDRDVFHSVTARSDGNKTYARVYLPDLELEVERKVGKPLWGRSDEADLLKERAAKREIEDEKGLFNYVKFKAGEARDCVAIFNKLDPGASRVTITVDGLSNDFQLLEREGGGRQIQSRNYVLELERPGDEYGMGLDRFRTVRSGWSKKLTDLVLPAEGAPAREAGKPAGKAEQPREGAVRKAPEAGAQSPPRQGLPLPRKDG